MKALFRQDGWLERSAIRSAQAERYLLAREYIRAKLGRDAEAIARYRDANAIFIHTPKCAGKSVGQALGLRSTHRPARFFLWRDKALFERAFKFGFCRDPFDRLVSSFHYVKFKVTEPEEISWRDRHLDGIGDFRDFLAALEDPQKRREILAFTHFLPQSYFLCDAGGKPMVDFIGRFETLADDFAHIAERLGKPASLEHINKSNRQDARDYFPEGSDRLIHSIYGNDFKVFGYPARLGAPDHLPGAVGQ